MRFVRTYARVLGVLRDDRGIVVLLVVANVLVAALQFVDPVLFGRVIGLLSGAQKMTPAALDTDGTLSSATG